MRHTRRRTGSRARSEERDGPARSAWRRASPPGSFRPTRTARWGAHAVRRQESSRLRCELGMARSTGYTDIKKVFISTEAEDMGSAARGQGLRHHGAGGASVARVAIVFRRGPPGCASVRHRSRLAEEPVSLCPRARAFAFAALAAEDDVKAMYRTPTLGGIDVLYNNAGIRRRRRLDPRPEPTPGPRPGREHEGRLLLLQARDPVPARAAGIGDQVGVASSPYSGRTSQISYSARRAPCSR